AADLASNTRVLIAIVQMLGEAKAWKLLNDNITVLNKKHGFLKVAVQKMIQECMKFIEVVDGKEKLDLINTIRLVTEGKIFVEVERARVTKLLSKIKENENQITEACDILQDLQVETYGSMDKREKTDFILEQMRLTLAKLDYVRVMIISKKINSKYFQDVANEDLKLRFNDLMIQHALYEDNYLSVCKYYSSTYDSPSIKADDKKWKPVS
ncbi:26S proteasome non-ATPase regulatory subunit 12, partial [Clydaea vesicula]